MASSCRLGCCYGVQPFHAFLSSERGGCSCSSSQTVQAFYLCGVLRTGGALYYILIPKYMYGVLRNTVCEAVLLVFWPVMEPLLAKHSGGPAFLSFFVSFLLQPHLCEPTYDYLYLPGTYSVLHIRITPLRGWLLACLPARERAVSSATDGWVDGWMDDSTGTSPCAAMPIDAGRYLPSASGGFRAARHVGAFLARYYAIAAAPPIVDWRSPPCHNTEYMQRCALRAMLITHAYLPTWVPTLLCTMPHPAALTPLLGRRQRGQSP